MTRSTSEPTDGSGSASVRGDVIVESGSSVIPAGVPVGSIVITLDGDGDVESDEDFTVEVAAVMNATIGAATARVTIVNDDVPASTPATAVVPGADDAADTTGDSVLVIPTTAAFQAGMPMDVVGLPQTGEPTGPLALVALALLGTGLAIRLQACRPRSVERCHDSTQQISDQYGSNQYLSDQYLSNRPTNRSEQES